MSNAPKTLFQKIWDSHVVHQENGRALLYIDLHLVHEVTSPQAFEALRLTNRKVRRPELTLATMDHNVPTTNRSLPIVDDISAKQMQTLTDNCAEFGVTLYDLNDIRQGIVHVIGPEQGLTQPGMTIVCGDSHTLDARRLWRFGPLASEHRKSSTFWRRKLCRSSCLKRWKFTSRATAPCRRA